MELAPKAYFLGMGFRDGDRFGDLEMQARVEERRSGADLLDGGELRGGSGLMRVAVLRNLGILSGLRRLRHASKIFGSLKAL